MDHVEEGADERNGHEAGVEVDLLLIGQPELTAIWSPSRQTPRPRTRSGVNGAFFRGAAISASPAAMLLYGAFLAGKRSLQKADGASPICRCIDKSCWAEGTTTIWRSGRKAERPRSKLAWIVVVRCGVFAIRPFLSRGIQHLQDLTLGIAGIARLKELAKRVGKDR